MIICMIMIEERDGEKKNERWRNNVYQNKILRGNGGKNKLQSFGRQIEKKEVEILESKNK